MYGIPSMYAPEHIRAWKVVTDAVHAKGAYMACQLWHVSLPFLSHSSELGTDGVHSADVSQSQSSLEVVSHLVPRPRISVLPMCSRSKEEFRRRQRRR